jgi:hypothetical protein
MRRGSEARETRPRALREPRLLKTRGFRMRTSYLGYYHGWRIHQSLEMDAPNRRPVHAQDCGEVVEFPEVGGLHHHYERRAA